MKFAPSFNIWEVPTDLLKHAQPGQWVYAGDRSNKGRFLGVKQSGTIVVAWLGNIRNQGDHAKRLEYVKTLRTYAKGDRK